MGLSNPPGTPRSGERGVLVLPAIAAVYFIWGSTYLGIRFGLEGFPPLLMNAIRFIIAGGVMYGWLRRRGAARPTLVQWRNSAVIGTLLLVGGVGFVTIAEDLGVGSGLVATAVAVMPLWAALWAGVFGLWPRCREWSGLAIGFGGVALLAQAGDFRSTAVGTILVLAAPILWSFGSVWSGRVDLPDNSMATAAQMITGGAIFAVLGSLSGESLDGFPPLKATLALVYLIVMGSLIAYSAYMYLLRTVRPSLATSYAYANPIVAIALGATVGAETITRPAWIALPVILVALALVGYGQRQRGHMDDVARASHTSGTKPVPFAQRVGLRDALPSPTLPPVSEPAVPANRRDRESPHLPEGNSGPADRDVRDSSWSAGRTPAHRAAVAVLGSRPAAIDRGSGI